MATLAAQKLSRAGAAITYSAASAGGDKTTPGDHRFLHVINGDASSHTVTLTVPNLVFGHPVTITATSVPAGANRFIGPLIGALLGPSPAWTYDAVTSVTVAVVDA